MVRLSTWMPFRPASRELVFFTGVQVAEATIRHVTEQVGAGKCGCRRSKWPHCCKSNQKAQRGRKWS
jgi:hypothetical protein